MVHKSGKLTCNGGKKSAKWGCDPTRNIIFLVITNTDNQVVLPSPSILGSDFAWHSHPTQKADLDELVIESSDTTVKVGVIQNHIFLIICSQILVYPLKGPPLNESSFDIICIGIFFSCLVHDPCYIMT